LIIFESVERHKVIRKARYLLRQRTVALKFQSVQQVVHVLVGGQYIELCPYIFQARTNRQHGCAYGGVLRQINYGRRCRFVSLEILDSHVPSTEKALGTLDPGARLVDALGDLRWCIGSICELRRLDKEIG